MSQQVDTNTKTFEVDEAIPLFARVKLDADGKITIAGLADKGIGTAQRRTFEAGEEVAVKLWSASGTHQAIANEAVTVGAVLFTEADGKVQDTSTSTSFQFATAMHSVAGDGEIIEILYTGHGTVIA